MVKQASLQILKVYKEHSKKRRKSMDWLQEHMNQIVLGDSYELIKKIPDKSIDLIITDPPYGLGIDYQDKKICKNKKHNRKLHEKQNWDDNIPSEYFFDEMKRVSKKMVVFGANYFNEYLDQGHKGWIVWDKGQKGLTMSDCEIIYTNFDKPTRIFVCNRVELKNDISCHPTQKPLKLMLEIVKKYSNEGEIIADFFAGSGAVLEACKILNRNYVGIEIKEKYFYQTVDRLNGINPLGQTSIFTNFEKV